MMRRLLLAALLGVPLLAAGAARAETRSAVFAGGCFWCVEEAFDKVPGVAATISGYAGGSAEDATYRQVSGGGTGHIEVVKVDYDPSKVGYEELLQTFWRNVDPFDPRGQFCDKGSQYVSAIFVEGEEERRLAEASRQQVAQRFDREVATEIKAAVPFYPAEDYHQNFYQTNSAQYTYYKWGCGRAQRLEEIWGKPAT